MSPGRAKEQKRVALVIGNGAYTDELALSKSAKDGDDLARLLGELGFKVTPCRDGKKNDMRAALDAFARDCDGAATALIYYSGHGVQWRDENYMIPVDFDAAKKQFLDDLVPIQPTIAAAAKTAQVTLVFLDACRESLYGERSTPVDQFARAKGLPIDKLKTGLARPQKDHDIKGQMFFAYAAAPGGLAYEGRGENSLFTEGLLANLETTDLSLGNLMLRISRHVQERSSSAQEPWMTSSLSAPFFFNPGSLMWFSANILGLVAFLVAVASHTSAMYGVTWQITYWLGISIPRAFSLMVLAAFVMIAAFAIFLFGLSRAYSFVRGEFGDQRAEGVLALAQRSVFGGFLGGILAAPVIAAAYYFFWTDTDNYELVPFGWLLAEIEIAAVATGALLGGASFVVANLLADNPPLRAISSNYWLLIGGILGGVVVGIFVGPAVVLYFGSLNRPPASPEALLPGSYVGVAAVVFSVTTYSIERTNYRKLLRDAGIALAATAIVGLLSGVLFWIIDVWFDNLIDSRVDRLDTMDLVVTGLIFGPITGFLLGAAIGLALVMLRQGPRAVKGSAG